MYPIEGNANVDFRIKKHIDKINKSLFLGVNLELDFLRKKMNDYKILLGRHSEKNQLFFGL